MDPQDIKKLLASVRSKRVSVSEAMQRLRSLPTEPMGYARYDTHRALRRGFPEVILAQGKTDDQVLGILQRIAPHRHPILVTRATEDLYMRAVEFVPTARYHE